MNSIFQSGIRLGGRNRQRGVALYVSMIMLLLLTLLGIAAMQVATLQQRMATNYNDFGMAFQRAEGALRNSEFELQRSFDTGALRTETYGLADASAWANTIEPGAVPTALVRKLADNCVSVRSRNPGAVRGQGRPCYQLTAASADRDASANPTSVVVIETVYVVPPQVRP